MASMTKAARAERDEAIAKLREWIKPGDTVYTILDHVSSSGMSRAIRVVLLSCEDGRAVDLHPNYSVGKALGLRRWRRNGREQDSLVVGRCSACGRRSELVSGRRRERTSVLTRS
jgi:hypothetical protein